MSHLEVITGELAWFKVTSMARISGHAAASAILSMSAGLSLNARNSAKPPSSLHGIVTMGSSAPDNTDHSASTISFRPMKV
jgi:hypothetical protein